MLDLSADPKLRAHVERLVALLEGHSEDLRLVCGLMDACQFFLTSEGDRSPSAGEALRLLLCEELRPAVREWYRKAGANLNPHALEFRARLGSLAGEDFSPASKLPDA